MKEVLRTILISTITNGTVLALFVWVFKQLFDASLKRRTELFIKEIELINKKHYYQFSKLYDEQAQVIKEVYAELVHMSDQVAYLGYHYNLIETHPELFEQYRTPKDGDPIKWEKYLRATITEKIEEIKAKELANYASNVLSKFKKKRIYFSEDIAEKIERLITLILFIASEFQNVIYRDSDDFKPVIADEVIKLWTSSIQVTNELFPVLEKLFREHLTVGQD